MEQGRIFSGLAGLTAAALCLALLAAPARAADPDKKPLDFRGVPFGAPAASIKGLSRVEADGDFSHYDRAGDKLDLGGIPLTYVTYSFYTGKFYHAAIAYADPGAAEAVRQSLSAKYGPPDAVVEKTDPEGRAYSLASWNWPGHAFIGHKHYKDASGGRIFYFYAPLADASAGAAKTPPPAKAARAGDYAPYTVQKGDTVEKLARARGVTAADVLRGNPGLDPKKLRDGKVIMLPGRAGGETGASGPAKPAGADKAGRVVERTLPEAVSGQASGREADRPAATTDPAVKNATGKKNEPAAPAAEASGAVKPEAGKDGTTKPEGVKSEGVKPEGAKPETTKPEGAKPETTKSDEPAAKSASPVSAPGGGFIEYKMREEDIISRVAKAHGVKTQDVLAANPHIKPTAIKPGTVIRVPVPAKTPSGAAPAPQGQGGRETPTGQ